ncbi:MAG: DUF4843 domain-containing protein [Bacteroides sp.]|nr:DUF4843 domain-containing protein [Bacteroides sp.]
MKKMKSMIYALAAIGMFTACENDKFYYQDEARARIEGPYEWALGTDSLDFSFAVYPSSVKEQVMDMTLYVMGEAGTVDRTARLEVDADKTTATAAQYELPASVTVPAGQLEAAFTVTLKRTDDLTAKTVALCFKVVDSPDFKTGVIEQNHFNLKWNDILGKPKNWDTELKEFFGEYSLVKYRFIIDTIGFGEFGGSMSWSELMNYKIRMTTALDEYNAAHPDAPLTDENGQLVTF